MEKQTVKENNTLYITALCFKILLEGILKRFKEKYKGNPATGRVTQLFGFGNYDANLPNLRTELEQLTGGFINGKYLYDKRRDLQSGTPILKLNGFYKTVLFQYIGFDGIEDFVEEVIEDVEEKQKQLQLITDSFSTQNHFYVCYHFGEYKEIVKSQVIVSNNWKNAQYQYLYPKKDGSFKIFEYFGGVRRRGDIIHIPLKTLMDGKIIESGENMLYVGYSELGNSAFILGVFCAFDINNRVIAGKLIHERCANKEEMIAKSKDSKVPAYIAQEIRNIRIENDSIIPNDRLEISAKSPYSITYDKIPGRYGFKMLQNNEALGDFDFSIDSNTFKISSLTEGVLITKDKFDLIQNGTVLHFSFEITGIALFTRLEVFVKTYYLNKDQENIKGVFSGLDVENRLISGEVSIAFENGDD